MMDAKAGFDFDAARRDREGIERAFIAAARDAIKLHRFHELPIVVWRDNQVAHISVDEYESAVNDREAQLNARFAKPKAAE